ncbi:MAG: PEP-CTERM sorting domain-containing protein [Candidatus Micrarchaeaceae archaeon]
MLKRLTLALFVVVVLTMASTSTRADALHGFCTTLTCSDNGNVTPVNASDFTFGFWAAGGSKSGDDILVFISPTALTTSQLTVSETNTGTSTGTATLAGDWTGGQLDAFLGLNGSPTNPFGNYGTTAGLDNGVSSFDVYTLNLGSQTLRNQASDGSGPLFSVNGESSGLFILDFLSNCTSTDTHHCAIATANSAALEVNATTTPEPSSLLMLGLGLAGLLAFGGWRRNLAAANLAS